MSIFIQDQAPKEKTDLERSIETLKAMGKESGTSLSAMKKQLDSMYGTNPPIEKYVQVTLAAEEAFRDFAENGLKFIKEHTSLEKGRSLDSGLIRSVEKDIIYAHDVMGVGRDSPENARLNDTISEAQRNSATNKLAELERMRSAPSIETPLTEYVREIRQQFLLGGIDFAKNAALELRIKEAAERFDDKGQIRWQIGANGIKLDLNNNPLEAPKAAIPAAAKSAPKNG